MCHCKQVFAAVQVYSIGPTFVERVMCRIVEQVAEEICRLFQCVAKFSPSSAVQVLLTEICMLLKPLSLNILD